MAELTFAAKDAATITAEVLQIYQDTTGEDLAPADPRRLFLDTIILLLVQCRALIDFAGKQNLIRYVTDLFIDALAELLGATRNTATPSTTTIRFVITVGTVVTIPAGKRVTNGAFIWSVLADTTNTSTLTDHVDVLCECTTAGAASNGYAAGQIATMVDSIVGVTSASNTTPSSDGTDVELLEAFRTRLRSIPEARAVAGPRRAYEALALAASSAVADAVALGPDDAAAMDGAPPPTGSIYVLVTEGARDQAGTLTSTIPDPSGALITAVNAALSAEDVRPLGDQLTVKAPEFVDFDTTATWYIAASRSEFVAEIQDAVADALDAYLLWQQSSIGRDVNPSEFIARLVNAGAKRVAVADPAFASLKRDQCARSLYVTLNYGGIEDD